MPALILIAAGALAIGAASAVQVAEVVQGSAVPRTAVLLRAGQPGTLAVVVDDGERCFAALPVRFAGRACEPLGAEALGSIRWFITRPEPREYDNFAACGREALARGCHAPIAYRVQALPAMSGTGVVDVRDVPELAVLGTRRIGVALAWHGSEIASAIGLRRDATVGEATTSSLVEVVVRRDDGYVGYLTELLGTPFVYAPVTLADGRHQTDARLGADCAALVAYGRRRMGEAVRYVAPPGLRQYADRVRGPVREGDVLHFGFQTAVLSGDRPPVGRLNADDLVIHTYHGVAEEVPFGSVPYRNSEVEVLRWRE